MRRRQKTFCNNDRYSSVLSPEPFTSLSLQDLGMRNRGLFVVNEPIRLLEIHVSPGSLLFLIPRPHWLKDMNGSGDENG